MSGNLKKRKFWSFSQYHFISEIHGELWNQKEHGLDCLKFILECLATIKSDEDHLFLAMQ